MKKLKSGLLIIAFNLCLIGNTLALTHCNCTSSSWTSQGFLSTSWHYASNNGSCTPNGSNIYNFGYADSYLNGEYIGTTQYGLGRMNINDYMNCFNGI